MRNELKALAEIFGLTIKDEQRWEEALTHASWLFAHPDTPARHNERLEFLGDAVLQLVVSIILFEQFPERAEGELTLIRSRLVSRDRLAQIAKTLRLDRAVRFGFSIKGKGLETVLGNALEAVVGAYFLEQGFTATRSLIEKYFLNGLDALLTESAQKDAKSRLQELLQERNGVLPEYRVLDETGPPHDRRFRVGVFLDQTALGEAEGRSKQEAETNAAVAALATLGQRD